MALFANHYELLPRSVANKVLLVACVLILCGILIAGLSPFTSHLPNEVHWLDRGNGLYFGQYATMVGSSPLHLDGLPEGPCSVELWVQPALLDDSNTMLAFETPETPLQFRIQQNNDALMLTRQTRGRDRRAPGKLIYIHHALQRDTPVFITVTAGPQRTAVYLNGVLTRSAPDFGLTRRDLNGGIVVGNSPVINDSWSGLLRGIGIYNRELTAEEVRQNYEEWTGSGQPKDLETKKAVALYAFSERSGNVAHSAVSSGVNLEIPKYYVVLYPPFLEPFWQHWGWNWAFWKDGIVNVVGFIPLGFFFCAYLSLNRPVGRAVLLTIILGCIISFFIEATQYFLPTRDSDSMDFINNTLGTIVGALCYLPRFVRNLVSFFGVVTWERRHPRPVPDTSAMEVI